MCGIVHDQIKATPRDVIAAHVDVFISMLPQSSHVEDVYLGPDGVLGHDGQQQEHRSGSRPVGFPHVMIDCSTITPSVALKVSRALGAVGGSKSATQCVDRIFEVYRIAWLASS